ncbi:MAG: hypothetical protein K5663_02520 [Clostridiales bacterium]|nr:hypothetical protein [Clostridiales bacterium]
MEFCVKREAYTLKVDYVGGRVVYENPCGIWKMKLEPCIIFSDGRRAVLPAPGASSAREAAVSDDIYADYSVPGSEMTLHSRISVEKTTGELVFEVWAEGDKPGEIEYLYFPSPWQAADSYTVLPRSQGEIVPFGSEFKAEKSKIFERTAYMPMFGGVNADGSAYLAVFDTPWDASYDYLDGSVYPIWRTSLGTLRYQRRMIYSFFRGDYNDVAKRYRAYVRNKGALITLKAKQALNPLVGRLPGCPVIHTGLDRHISPDSRYYRPDEPEYNDSCVTFIERAEQIRQLKRKGLKKAYTHFDGWGFRGYDNLHPSPLPPSPRAGGAEGMKQLMDTVRECGYLFGIHDQYRDYYYDTPFFTFDEARRNIDGSHSHNHIWYGGHYAYLCAQKAVGYVRQNYNLLEQMGIKPDSAYLDVFSLAELDECFNPRHMMSREQSVKYRRECLDFLSARGIISSSEETLDCILPSQVLCHHAPFIGDEVNDPSRAKPIPLFNLVYHDCVLIPWIGLPGEKGGSGLPDGMSTYLYAILNAGPVYCPIDADENVIGQVETACAVSEKLFHAEMVRHEFLNADGMKQSCLYSDGTLIEVDMENGAWKASNP